MDTTPQPVPLHATPWRRLAPEHATVLAPDPQPPVVPVVVAPLVASSRSVEQVPTFLAPTVESNSPIAGLFERVSDRALGIFSPIAIWSPSTRRQSALCFAQAGFWGWVGCSILPQDPAAASGISDIYLALLAPACVVWSCVIMAVGRLAGSLFSGAKTAIMEKLSPRRFD